MQDRPTITEGELTLLRDRAATDDDGIAEHAQLVDEADPPAHTVLVDASVISHADTTAVAMLDDLIDQLALRGVTFELARVKSGEATFTEKRRVEMLDRTLESLPRTSLSFSFTLTLELAQ